MAKKTKVFSKIRDTAIKMRLEEDLLIVYLCGNFSGDEVNVHFNKLTDYLENKRTNTLINMKELSYISSTGVGFLMAINNTFEEMRKKFALVESPSSLVKKVLKLAGLSKATKIYKDEKSALKSMLKKQRFW